MYDHFTVLDLHVGDKLRATNTGEIGEKRWGDQRRGGYGWRNRWRVAGGRGGGGLERKRMVVGKHKRRMR